MEALNWLETTGEHPGGKAYDPSKSHNMRGLVLDYLIHQGFAKTARTLIESTTSAPRLDADGDEIMSDNEPLKEMLRLSEIRHNVRTHLLSGRVEEATALLNEHFPTVLDCTNPTPPTAPRESRLGGMKSGTGRTTVANYIPTTSIDPAILSLNLRIHTFIEASRSTPLLHGPLSADDMAIVVEDLARQLKQLERMRKMNAVVNALENPEVRSRYIEEIHRVVSLIAYRVPENSPMSFYLDQDRREALANQVHSAIMYRLGLPTISHMELYVRQSSTVFSYLHELEVRPPPTKGYKAANPQASPPDIAPRFQLSSLLNTRI